jgi:hypothetical protein
MSEKLHCSRLRQRREALFLRQPTLGAEQYDYNYHLQHSIDAAAAAKFNEQQGQSFIPGMPPTAAAATTTAITSASSPYERDSFNSSENDYYKAWQTQKRMAPVQPMAACTDSTMIGYAADQMTDHIYESPKFVRKDFTTFNKS